MSETSAKPLRKFIAYFKDGRAVEMKCAGFALQPNPLKKTSIRVPKWLLTESGKTGAAVLNLDEIVAIKPAYDAEYKGPLFRVTLKSSATTIEIRAANIGGGSVERPEGSISFFDADGNYIDDVWVLGSEVLACIPVEGLPEAIFSSASKASPSS